MSILADMPGYPEILSQIREVSEILVFERQADRYFYLTVTYADTSFINLSSPLANTNRDQILQDMRQLRETILQQIAENEVANNVKP